MKSRRRNLHMEQLKRQKLAHQFNIRMINHGTFVESMPTIVKVIISNYEGVILHKPQYGVMPGNTRWILFDANFLVVVCPQDLVSVTGQNEIIIPAISMRKLV